MTHLDIIRKAYDDVGIRYVVRSRGGEGDHALWSYLFVVGDRDMSRAEVESTDLDWLCQGRAFMEFRDGAIASY